MLSPRVIPQKAIAAVSQASSASAWKKSVSSAKLPTGAVSSKFVSGSRRSYITHLGQEVELLPTIKENKVLRSKIPHVKYSPSPPPSVADDALSISSEASSTIPSRAKNSIKLGVSLFFILGVIGGGLIFHYTKPSDKQ